MGKLDTPRLIVFTSLKSVEHVDKQDTLLGVVNPRRGRTSNVVQQQNNMVQLEGEDQVENWGSEDEDGLPLLNVSGW